MCFSFVNIISNVASKIKSETKKEIVFVLIHYYKKSTIRDANAQRYSFKIHNHLAETLSFKRYQRTFNNITNAPSDHRIP